MLDSRRDIRGFINKAYKVSIQMIFAKFTISFLLAYTIAFIPTYDLTQNGVYTFFILLFASGLWISEAIPAFAVSLLVIALEIILLGFNNFDFSTGSKEWQTYLKPWSSPLIFLFLAGFIMAEAASKIKLDLWLAKRVLFYVGGKPKNIITGILVITLVLSMFVSNTATAAMMITILSPLLAHIKKENPFSKALLLTVVVGANIGGMITIIGTPPNAIAVGILGEMAPSFIGWIILAGVPAISVAFMLRFMIIKLYPSNEDYINLDVLKNVNHYDDSTTDFTKIPTIPSWKKIVTIAIFSITILLWLTGPIHHIPTTVVSLLPIIGFTLFGILDAEDICKIRWDVIILIIGGLSLGQAVSKTGLDLWFASLISTDGLSILLIMFIFSYMVVVISNFMSNTAATNIMLPIVVAIASTISVHYETMTVVAVALSASFAMMLPVSTPPNAIIYSSKKVNSKDFLRLGIVTAIIGPVAIISWLFIIENFI